MLARRFLKSRGDTLIEVLFATATFSLVAVGGIAIMNKGTAASQRALEITLVRNEIDSQAETLRFLNASYIAAYQPGVSNYGSDTPAQEWKTMHDNIVATNASSATSFGSNGTSCPTLPKGSFILNTRKAKFVSSISGKFADADTYSKVAYDASSQLINTYGIWIEAVRSTTSGDVNQADAGYIDFYINACWYSSGQVQPVTIGTIVRLYEPR